MPRKTIIADSTPPEEHTEDTSIPTTFDAQRADARLKDVSGYVLPEELDAKLAFYAMDDPKFADHVKRAHKIYHTYPGAKGEERWKIEVKMFDYDSGEFSKFGPYFIDDIPTPQDLRDANAYGRLRLMVHYWTPTKTVKGNRTRPGIMTVMSKPFEIAPPVVLQGTVSPPSQIHMQQNAPAMALPPASFVDSFQAMFAQTQSLMMQAANAQMEILANRQKIVDEGVEKGRLLQQVEIQNLQIAELMKTIKGFQSVREDDDEQDYSSAPASVTNPQTGGMSPMLGVLIEKLAPVVLDKLGLNGAAAGAVSEAVKGAASAPPNAGNTGDGQQS